MSNVSHSSFDYLDFSRDRDATLKLIDWFAIERVRAARMLFVGAGAIGNEALKCAALLGIGNIYIIDRDTIEMSNLSRSVLYRAADAGAHKAETAARALRELNPNISVHPIVGDLRCDVGLGLLRQMDVVMGCLDSRVARFHLNRLCRRAGVAYIDAGIGQLNGQVQVFLPDSGPCYECALGEVDYQEIKVGCADLASRYLSEGKVPTTPTIASIVAGVQLQEALKLLDQPRWRAHSLAGREFTFNGEKLFSGIAGLPERHNCPAHATIKRERIVALPEAKAATTTVNEIVAAARERLGESAFVRLNYELAVELRCAQCGHCAPVLRPKLKLFKEDLQCARCGTAAELLTTNKLGAPDGATTTDLADFTLAQLGVAPLDLLQGCGLDGASLYLELTGDAADWLPPASPTEKENFTCVN